MHGKFREKFQIFLSLTIHRLRHFPVLLKKHRILGDLIRFGVQRASHEPFPSSLERWFVCGYIIIIIFAREKEE